MDTLKEELSIWSDKQNEDRATIKWLFDLNAARSKLHKAYDKLRLPTNQN